VGTEKRARQKELHRSRLEAAREEAARQARRAKFIRFGVIAVVAIALVVLVAVLTGDDDTDVASDDSASTTASVSTTEAGPTTTAVPTPCPPTDGSGERTTTFSAPFAMCIDAERTYRAAVDTTLGSFTIELEPQRAPLTVNNFVSLARSKFYDGLTFHRIVPDFVIQGGDPAGDGTGGPGYQFQDELPQPDDYEAYSVAMANSGPDTNGSQFFVVLSEKGADTLVSAVGGTANYSLFGKVVEGTDVVDKIAAVELDGERPVTPVTIEKVTITES
jgi:cyclophilin family peptidyl-prolyl cis-trans isomerase